MSSMIYYICLVVCVIYAILPLECGNMMDPVEYKGMSKWVRVPKTEDVYSYPEFLQGGNLSVICILMPSGVPLLVYV